MPRRSGLRSNGRRLGGTRDPDRVRGVGREGPGVVAGRRSASRSSGTLIARAKSNVDRSGATLAERGEPIRVMFADDSYLIREALQEVLTSIDAIDLVDCYADG